MDLAPCLPTSGLARTIEAGNIANYLYGYS